MTERERALAEAGLRVGRTAMATKACLLAAALTQ